MNFNYKMSFFEKLLLPFLFFLATIQSFGFDTIYTSKDSVLIHEIETLFNVNYKYENMGKLKSRDSVLQKAYILSKKINHLVFIAKIEELISQNKSQEDDDKTEALQFTLKAIDSYKLCNNKKHYPQLTNLYVQIIDINNVNHNFEDRKSFIDSANTYLAKIEDKKDKLVALISINRIYLKVNSPSLVFKYLKELDHVNKNVNDSVLNLIRLRLHEEYLNITYKIDEALIYNDSAITQALKIPDNSFLMYDYYRRAKLLKNKKNITQSLAFLNKSYQLALSENHIKFQVLNLTEKSDLMFLTKNYSLSLKYAMASYNLCIKYKFTLDAMKCLKTLYQIDSLKNNVSDALIYLKLYSKLRDSLFPISEYKNRNLTSYLDIAKIKNYNLSLESENKQKDKLLRSELLLTKFLWVVTFLALLFALLMLLFYFSYKRQTKMLIVQKNQIIEKNLEMKDKNENLERLYQEKNDLISIVSHDLKAPLNRAKALSDLILDTADNFSPEQKMLFQKLIKELADEKILITEIFNSEILELEISNINLETVDINTLLINFVEAAKVTAQSKSIKIELAPYRDKIFLLANEAYLKRIVDNLVSNAIKFSNRGTKIAILVDSFDKEVYIHIKDEGLGFTEQDQKEMFKKYHKLSSKPTEGESSTGLGLSIVKRLVQVMKGNISLVSKKGVGSTFSLSFKRVIN